MILNNSFYKRKYDKNLKRKIGNRGNPRDVFLIICEGEKTEPNYFRSFKLSFIYIMNIEGLGLNTLSLVEETIKIKKFASSYGTIYDQVWCVFDKDDFPDDHFNKAIEFAKKENIKVAYSNESFELWYLLHFGYFDSAINRKDYIKKLNKKLGRKYEKNNKLMYNELLNKQNNAIINAEKLLSKYKDNNPSKNNPSTTVHLLVQEINKFLK